MTDDVATLLREAADDVPPRPGGLDAVEHRARQRTRRGRTALAAGVAVVALLAFAALRVPAVRPPVVDSRAPADVHLSPCAPSLCPDDEPDLDQVAEIVRADPAVVDVRVVDPATQRRLAAERSGQPIDEIPVDAFGGSVEVVLASDTDRLLPVARRLAEQTHAGVRRPGATGTLGNEGLDPDAAIGDPVEVATVEVGGHELTVRSWAVERGGRCLAVGELVSCGWDDLLSRSAEDAAWGRPAEDVTCVWAGVGYEVDSIRATFADGSTVDGVIGDGAPWTLAGAGLACTAARTHPVELAWDRRQGGGSHGGFATHSEVRPPDQLGWDALLEPVFAELTPELADELADRDVPARQDAITQVLTQTPLPGGASVLVTDRDHRDEGIAGELPATEVEAVITPDRGDPVCVAVQLQEPDEQPRLVVRRPAIWTPEGRCVSSGADTGP